MSITFAQAVDDMFTMVKDAWDTTGYPAKWPNRRFEEPNPPTAYIWPTISHFAGGQRGFGSSSRMFERRGNLIVRVCVPAGGGLHRGYELAKVIADAFEGKSSPNGVWFRNTHIREGVGTENYEIVNFEAIFSYDEVK